MSKAVATKPDLSLVKPDYISDQARGSEDVGIADVTIPRLEMIQSLSPQRLKNDASYIEGAEEGMIFNTVTNHLHEESVLIVPVVFRKEYLAWKDRKLGGGFAGAHASIREANEAIMEQEDPENWEATETAQHFCLQVNEGGVEEVVVSMSKTKLKISRQLNSMIRIAGGDRFSRTYELSTQVVDGALGTYYNWKIKQLGYPSEEVYAAAESLYKAVTAGQRDIDRDSDQG